MLRFTRGSSALETECLKCLEMIANIGKESSTRYFIQPQKQQKQRRGKEGWNCTGTGHRDRKQTAVRRENRRRGQEVGKR
jgi:hypothetical protein